MSQGIPLKQNLLGKRFGKLTVVSPCGKRGASWNCRCECGATRKLYTSDLLGNHNITCGCGAGKQTLRHGFAAGESEGKPRHRFYRIWDGIRKRCTKPDDDHYPRYGGRGVKLHWQNIDQFKDDMFASYEKHVEQFGELDTTIDRIDNDGDYCKENCRWATRKEQGRNRATNVHINYRGRKMTVSEYAEIKGVSRLPIYSLLNRYSEAKTKRIVNRMRA